MRGLESVRSLFSNKVLGYGSIGIGSALFIQLTAGFGSDHPILLALEIVFWILFSSSMAWTFWEFVLPMAGRESPHERK